MKILKSILVIAFALIGSLMVANALGDLILTPIVFGLALVSSYVMGDRGLAFGSLCGNVSAGVTLDCLNPIVPGVDADLILFNRGDIDPAAVTFNGTNNLIIEALGLTSPAVAFKFEGKNLSVVPKQSLVKKDFSELFEHLVDLYVFTSNGAIKKNLESMAKGDLCAIVLNKFTGTAGNAAYELYGYDSGLQMFVLERNLGDDVTGSAYKIQLKSHPKSLEPHLPRNIFITSLALSKAVVDGLL